MKKLLPLLALFFIVGCDESETTAPNDRPAIENPIAVDPGFDIPVEGEEEGVLYYHGDDNSGEFIKNGIVVASTDANGQLLDINIKRIGSVTHWNRDSEDRPTGLIFTFDESYYFDGNVFEPSYSDGSGQMEYHTDRDVYDGAVTISAMPHDS
ncbi:hypothetical protein BCS96_18380 [Vibrio breoganii]|uniref:hypothetical protein n=1 Tax=Vibrio breoganii TaxID=553239 RepID=UPI000C85BE09|nr:hypothetical protein [Vibrio breoganii]PMG12543.1 hypothetical protein BCV00_00150 [Vibrio breoganii]PMG82454.1 hypothetical protein BCU81_16380 [Vibrio breoganii]PMI23849.1 hypothetical protein BCU49_17595 [Vibrio breoganii]PMK76999.1 hypothetical protein BCT94_06515 [Vibrio breoganii]PML27689.1 hypothetical protein BCT82_08265 [Vibrio breoganii]